MSAAQERTDLRRDSCSRLGEVLVASSVAIQTSAACVFSLRMAHDGPVEISSPMASSVAQVLVEKNAEHQQELQESTKFIPKDAGFLT